MYYIAHYRSKDGRFGYNMNDGGGGNAGGYYSPETRAKMGEKVRQRLAKYNPLKGRKLSPEHIAKIKATRKPMCGKNNPNYGWKPPRELIERLAEMSRQRTGEKNSFYGRTHTQEVKDFLRNKFGRPVVQIDAKTLEEIKTFPSAGAAAAEVAKKKKAVSEICKVCNRYVNSNGAQYITACGYRWRWADEEYVHVEAKYCPPPII